MFAKSAKLIYSKIAALYCRLSVEDTKDEKKNGKEDPAEIPFEQIRDKLAQKVLTDKQQAAYSSKLNQLKILFPVDMF